MFDGFSLTLILTLFFLGYLAIICEAFLGVNKTTTSLALASFLWFILNISGGATGHEMSLIELKGHFLNICEFIFFLWGAMIIVEIINEYKGLDSISYFLNVESKRLQLWLIGFFSFFLSSVLDNLTTTIVMLSIIRKLVPEAEDKKIMGAAVVIAANAGGAWTPIGDVTTTMLWIGGQITPLPIMKSLFLPSAICASVSLFLLSGFIHGKTRFPKEMKNLQIHPKSIFMGLLGFLALLIVPAFKIMTGFPPFVGMLLVMSVMGIISDIIGDGKTGDHHPFHRIMTRVDTSTILFFLGILLSVDALETSGLLQSLAQGMNQIFSNSNLIPFSVGIVSSLIDNVPLVQACMGMYSQEVFPKDASFWHLIAYSAGVGGNLLIIGSAAGIAFMGIEKVSFFWYVKRVSLAAFIGYVAGFLFYFV